MSTQITWPCSAQRSKAKCRRQKCFRDETATGSAMFKLPG